MELNEKWKLGTAYYIRVYYVFTSPLVFLSRDMKTHTFIYTLTVTRVTLYFENEKY